MESLKELELQELRKIFPKGGDDNRTSFFLNYFLFLNILYIKTPKPQNPKEMKKTIRKMIIFCQKQINLYVTSFIF